MARLQVLHLPVSDGEARFVLVFDELMQAELDDLEGVGEHLTDLKRECGAAAILAVPFRVEVL